MKTLRLALLLAVLIGLVAQTHAADRAGIRGILITASNAPGETDRRLASYEPTLRRILRFESYRYAGEGSASLDVPGRGSLSLGRGHQLDLETEASSVRGLHLKIRWIGEGRTLLSTALALRPGVPAVLGGPASGRKDEVYAVILIGR